MRMKGSGFSQSAPGQTEAETSDNEALKALAQEERSTLFAVLVAALTTLFYRYSNQEDICIGFTTTE